MCLPSCRMFVVLFRRIRQHQPSQPEQHEFTHRLAGRISCVWCSSHPISAANSRSVPRADSRSSRDAHASSHTGHHDHIRQCGPPPDFEQQSYSIMSMSMLLSMAVRRPECGTTQSVRCFQLPTAATPTENRCLARSFRYASAYFYRGTNQRGRSRYPTWGA